MAVKKINKLNPPTDTPLKTCNRYEEYLSLLLNQVKIVEKGSGQPLPFYEQRYALTRMFESGFVGYDKIAKKFYRASGYGLNELGNPTNAIFYTENGLSYDRELSYDKDVDGCYLLYALPNKNVTISQIIHETTDFMRECDIASRQNLDACKTPYVAVCANEDIRTSLLTALREKQSGQSILIVSQELADALKSVSFEVPYLVDKFTEARDKERDALLTKFGILTANTDKKERVQSAEVNATLGIATDYIYMIIDTFNNQCETYAIPLEMQFNGSMEEIYTDNSDNVNDVEKGQKEYVEN